MLQLDAFHDLEVVAEKPFGVLLGDDAIVLPRGQVPEGCKLGATLRVFVYKGADGRPVATTKTPAAIPGQFACLRVVDSTSNGAYLDWGLDKDLYVPRREQTAAMIKDRSYVVAVTVDSDDRIMASCKIREFLDDDMSGVKVGQSVGLLVYERHERGLKVIVDDRYDGMVYKDDIYRELPIGSKLTGTVTKVREDARVDVRIRPQGRSAMSEGQAALVAALEQAGGFLALNDKSDPELIRSQLSMSKKAFKRAVGNLLRAGTVALEDDGVRLTSSGTDTPSSPPRDG